MINGDDNASCETKKPVFQYSTVKRWQMSGRQITLLIHFITIFE